MSKYEPYHDRVLEYLICQARGHTQDPMQGGIMNAGYNSVPKYICKYCKTTYWTTTVSETHEENAPEVSNE